MIIIHRDNLLDVMRSYKNNYRWYLLWKDKMWWNKTNKFRERGSHNLSKNRLV